MIAFAAKAQNTGIGTNAPQAPLHVSTSSSEVLRIQGNNPYLSLFDNTDGYRGYLWYRPETFTPFIRSIDLGSAVGSGLAVTISPGLQNTATFLPTGNVGIGTITPAEKLDVNGNVNLTGTLKVNNSSGTPGQVLVSNGGAAPTWQDAPGTNIGFYAVLAANQNIANSFTTTLTSYAEFFDTQNNFNSSTGVFTAPSTGVYHFDVTTNFVSPPANGRAFIRFVINGGTFGGCQKEVVLVATANENAISHSVTVPLNAGSTVGYSIFQATGAAIDARGGGGNSTACTFSGYKVY